MSLWTGLRAFIAPIIRAPGGAFARKRSPRDGANVRNCDAIGCEKRAFESAKTRSSVAIEGRKSAFKSHNAVSTAEIAIEQIPGRPRLRTERDIDIQAAEVDMASEPITILARNGWPTA